VIILVCTGNHIATKVWTGDTCKAYDLGYRFEHINLPVDSIYSLARSLEALTENYVVIRGQVKDGAPEEIRRTFKREDSWIETCPQQWVCLDFDKTSVTFDPAMPDVSVRQLVTSLPEGLREATCYWKLSSSQHKHNTFRGHLWFWLDRPYSDRELKTATKGIGCDPSLFSPVQPHYVAKPIFLDRPDPLPIRSGILKGLTDVATVKGGNVTRLKEMAQDRLEKAERKVARAKEGTRHSILNANAFELGSLCPHILTQVEVFQRLFEAARKAGMNDDEATDSLNRAMLDGMSKPQMIGEDWKGLLKLDKDFTPVATEENIRIILENDLEWDSVLGLNERTAEPVFVRDPPWKLLGGRSVQNTSASDLGKWLWDKYKISNAPKTSKLEALEAVAKDNPFDPVRDYLESLEWDGTERTGSLAADMLGDDTTVGREVLQAWLISAVKRAYEPGCQADHMIILEGDQGVGKTSFLRWLGGEWYANLRARPEDHQRAVQELQGAWLGCFDELSALRKGETEALKTHLSNTVDNVRLPYERRPGMYPRRSVLCGTVNPLESYYDDPTGMRRIWIVKVNKKVKVPDKHTRDQVWAEARHRYLAGETSWELSDSALLELSSRHTERQATAHDTWKETIATYLKDKSGPITTREILKIAIGMPDERHNGRASNRVAAIMLSLGWLRTHPLEPWIAPPDHVPVQRGPASILTLMPR
jgi:predicted P-loop ATPase